jgi:acyl-coenzyme A synthetase/AMP-(fatty) acid ligase
MSCSDDVINVSGHRLSCGAMEEVHVQYLHRHINTHVFIYTYGRGTACYEL